MAMDIESIFFMKAPLAVASAIDPSMLSHTTRQADQQKQTDNAAVKLNLSPAAQNMLSSPQDLVGGSPVPESGRQESNPSEDEGQQSRDTDEQRKDKRN
jgi:hypothetical protein